MSLQEFELYQKSNSYINTWTQKQDNISFQYLPIWIWDDLWWMVFKIIIPSTQFSVENIHNYFKWMWDDEKEKILAYWNFNTENILKYVNKETCLTYKWITDNLFKNKKIKGINIVLQWYELNLVLWCEVYFNYYNETEINAPWEKYREFNITQWLNTLDNSVWKVWEIYSIMKNIEKKTNYMDWYALVFKNNKVIHKLIKGGSLCWVSTIFYQNSLKTDNLDIIELYNHMNYYSMYYWKQIWLDATIYSENWIVYKDLKVKNNTKWNIIIKVNTISENWRFKYYIKFFSPFIPSRVVEGNNKIYKKNWKKCVSFSYWKNENKTIKESCYFWIE